ncbi:MAG: type III polyketide synthase [Balneolaceae bacterium]
MPSIIHTISTTTPEYRYLQDEVREQMKEWIGDTEPRKRLIHRLYSHSGIETRHSVLEDFKHQGSANRFFRKNGDSPGTETRNTIYQEKARQLFVQTATTLLRDSAFTSESITHLITVSCTGFYAPGPDFDIIRSLGLRKETERYHLGFMGCYAVLPALKLADQICRANRDARVMIVSVELCSLHFQTSPEIDNLISTTVFADGASGAIVSSDPPDGKAHFELETFASSITDEGEKDMAWTIGDNGFNMVLSAYIPDLLSKNLRSFLEPLFESHKLKPDEIIRWAIHPGGRAILDRVAGEFELPEERLHASRTVLSRYGNMSSATILFVLQEVLQKPLAAEQEPVLAMAFGPGLTIESAIMKRKPPAPDS